jgi:RimJ/RimL family protein N-acetyltransferase
VSPVLPIRMARPGPVDADAFARHMVDHMAESGRGGSPHFALSRRWVREEVRASFSARLDKDLDEPLWGRAWLLFAEDGVHAVGHLELRGGRVHAELHRATLGMGLMRAYTGQGHGRRLCEAAIAWARDEAELSWIDLGVFANNAPARKLYRSLGFVEIGVRGDAFHNDAGVVLDDVLMTLELR